MRRGSIGPYLRAGLSILRAGCLATGGCRECGHEAPSEAPHRMWRRRPQGGCQGCRKAVHQLYSAPRYGHWLDLHHPGGLRLRSSAGVRGVPCGEAGAHVWRAHLSRWRLGFKRIHREKTRIVAIRWPKTLGTRGKLLVRPTEVAFPALATS